METREPLTSMEKFISLLDKLACSEYKCFRLEIVEGVLCRKCLDTLSLDMETYSSGPHSILLD